MEQKFPCGDDTHRFSLAIPSDIAVFRAEIVINTARSFLLVWHRQNIDWMYAKNRLTILQ